MIKKSHHLLNATKYYKEEQTKKRIVLHHTVGGSAKSSIHWWNSNKTHICTPYLIDRDGTIYEVFNPKYWAYASGIGSSSFEKESIHIELCNYGPMLKEGLDIVEYKQEHRGYKKYEKYTEKQVESLIYLIDYLSKLFNIEIKDVEKFWWFDKDSKKTLISHTTIRKDKSDIHPQPDLIKAIYDYAGCKAKITE